MTKKAQNKTNQSSSSKLSSDTSNENEYYRMLIKNVAEDAQRKAEEKLRKIIMESLDGIVIADEQCAIIEWNSAQEAITGIKRCDAVGRPLWEIQFRLAPDDIKTDELVKQLKAGIAEIAQGKVQWPGRIAEQRIQCPGGAFKTVQSSSFAVRNESQIEVVAFLHDITEQKRSENALKESEKRFRALVENAFEGVSIIDTNGKIAYESEGLSRLLGYQPGENIGKGAFERIYPGDLTRAQELFKCSAVHPEQAFKMELRVRHKSGAWRWIECIGKNMLEDPAINGFVVNYRDITERKQAEEDLRESEKRFRSIIETSQEWIWAIDASARHTYCNPAVEKILGYSPEMMMGVDALQLMHSEDAHKVKAMLPEFIAQKKGWTGLVCRWKHKNGSYRFLESNSTPIINRDGELAGFWGADRDITERKDAEEERLRLEQQIHQSHKLESLGLLAGGIAHDFNNLMAGFFGYINLALASSKDSIVSNYLSAAMGAIDRARNLTSQLLTFAKGGAPVRETGALSPVIRDATNLALSGSTIAAAYDIAEDLWPCNYDKNQISQVIDNVVINAQQAMPGGGTVSVSAQNLRLGVNEIGNLPAGNYVRIAIADTGIGIAGENLQKIFDPFFTTKQKGSGLGLAICHSIVKKHSGWITVESSIGKGTLLSIYLPASREATMQTPSKKQASFHRGSGRILVMDDEAIIQSSMGKILSMLGYSVACRSNGKDALSFLHEEISAGRSFTAIILDLTIPGGMGGKEVAIEIRKMDLKIPVFVASGYSNDPVMADPGKHGFIDCICKPFTIDEISEIFNRHLVNEP